MSTINTLPVTAGHGTVSALPAMIETLMTLRGQFVSMTTERQAKVRKGCEPVVKRSTFVCRVGVNYDNIGAVKDKRETGELPEVNAGLPWGEWLEGHFPYVIAHKGQHYFRCTAVNGNDSCVPTVTWFRNGQVVDRSLIEADLLASEKGSNDDRDVFTVKVESILSVKVRGEVLTA